MAIISEGQPRIAVWVMNRSTRTQQTRMTPRAQAGAQQRRQPEREMGEAKDAVERELEQLGERHARPADGAFRAIVGDLDLAEAHPVAEAWQVPGALGHGQHRVERRAVDEREVPRTERRRNAGEPVVEEVEPAERGTPGERLRAGALGGEDDLRAVAPGLEQRGDELGRIPTIAR